MQTAGSYGCGGEFHQSYAAASVLRDQLARRNEVESLKSLCDTLGTQVGDAQQKLDGVAALQARLLPLTAQVTTLGESIARSQALVATVKQEESAVHEQKARLTELVEQSKALAAETADRLKQVQTVGDELGRAAGIKEELPTELALVQARQRDAVTQTEAAEDQLKRAETMVKQLEQRRTQRSFSEKKITTFEARLNDLTRATEAVEQKIKLIAEIGSRRRWWKRCRHAPKPSPTCSTTSTSAWRCWASSGP